MTKKIETHVFEAKLDATLADVFPTVDRDDPTAIHWGIKPVCGLRRQGTNRLDRVTCRACQRIADFVFSVGGER